MISLRPRRSPSGNTRLSFFGLTVTATLTALLVSVSVTGAASAYYTTPGTGSGSSALGTLLPPTDLLGPATSAGTVSLSWTASVGTPAPTGYYATRIETGTGTTAPACGSGPTSTVVTASCTDLDILTGDYTYTVTAVYNGWTAASAASGGVTVSNPTQLAFQAQPPSATSGTAFTGQPSVAILNAEGRTVPTSTEPVTLTITDSPAGATLECVQNPVAAVAGIATFTGCRIDKAGSYTLTATANRLAAATSSSFTIEAGAADQLSFTSQPSDATGGIAFGTQPVVTVQDAFGNTVTTSTASVTATATGPSLTCSPASNTALASAGIAAFTGCAIARAGTYTLTATAGLLTTTSEPVTVVVGAPATLAFTTQPLTPSTAGAALSATVAVQDAGGNTVTDSTNLVTLGVTNGSTTCGSSTPTAGAASFTGCTLDTAGTYTLSATSAGLAPAQSAIITITAGAATALIFSTKPASATGGLEFGTQPVITVQDAFGNTVTGSTATVTLGVTGSPATGVLICTATSVVAVAGVATFGHCKIDRANAANSSYTLAATSPGLISVSSNITVAVGVPAKLIVSQVPATLKKGSPFSPLVLIHNAGGNTVISSATVVLSSATSSNPPGSLTCPAVGGKTQSAVAGVATFSNCEIDKAGTYSVTATGLGFSATATVVITNNN